MDIKEEGKKKFYKTKAFRVLVFVVAALLILWGGFMMYASKYYHAGKTAVAIISEEHREYSIEENAKQMVFMPKNATVGIIFYPGAKVEYTAYAPLMGKLAENGVLGILVSMPYNLAILDYNVAKDVLAQAKESYPMVEDWYLAGHSLGGAMAAYHLADHSDEYRGLILLGAYSSKDLSKTNLKVMLIYGSEDYVLNRQKYGECKKNLPETYSEYIIDGGCHAFFGDYGEQKGDGIPTINPKDQIEDSVDAITGFIFDF